MKHSNRTYMAILLKTAIVRLSQKIQTHGNCYCSSFNHDSNALGLFIQPRITILIHWAFQTAKNNYSNALGFFIQPRITMVKWGHNIEYHVEVYYTVHLCCMTAPGPFRANNYLGSSVSLKCISCCTFKTSTMSMN